MTYLTAEAMNEDEELQRAFQMSLMPEVPGTAEGSSGLGDCDCKALDGCGRDRHDVDEALNPDAKRSKAEGTLMVATGIGGVSKSMEEETVEERQKRLERETRARAAESRMKSFQVNGKKVEKESPRTASAQQRLEAVASTSSANHSHTKVADEDTHRAMNGALEAIHPSRQLNKAEASQLFYTIFGASVSRDVISQWSGQGFRFSTDPATSLGLVQREGGPCGVLAPIQALVLKHLLFVNDVGSSLQRKEPPTSLENTSFSEENRIQALICAMAETLWRAGNNNTAVVASLQGTASDSNTLSVDGVKLDSGAALQQSVWIFECSSKVQLQKALRASLQSLASDLGALLFLFSALLSRGLDKVETDRDDALLPLVTIPFGHASQEIVNLLLCGRAVANVFDNTMDLGDSMRLQGVPAPVEVGFLTLLESLNLCKVGQHLKCPKWPIWVVGSETHYTVLFALSTTVQDESEAEARESKVRRAFDALDESGGGGMISLEALNTLLLQQQITLEPKTRMELASLGVVVWQDFWRAVCRLEPGMGGFKGTCVAGASSRRRFEVYHFNGIAKSVCGESPLPRLSKLVVSVPPKWTPDVVLLEDNDISNGVGDGNAEMGPPPQHAPLVDCIRTRWARATCTWTGETPSIV